MKIKKSAQGHLFRETRSKLEPPPSTSDTISVTFTLSILSIPVYPTATRPGYPSNIIVSRISTARVAFLIALELLRGAVSRVT